MKFLDKLTVACGSRVPIEEPMLSISLRMQDAESYNKLATAREYHLGIRLGSTILLDEDLVRESNGEVVDVAVRDMKASIARIVYGDIEEPLRDVLYSLQRKSYGHYSEEVQAINRILEMIRP